MIFQFMCGQYSVFAIQIAKTQRKTNYFKVFSDSAMKNQKNQRINQKNKKPKNQKTKKPIISDTMGLWDVPS